MKKAFVTTIRGGSDTPYLGTFEGEVSVKDLADAPEDIELISFGGKVKNIDLLPQLVSLRYVDLTDISAELIDLLALLPNLEVLSISTNRQLEWPSFKPLKNIKYLILYNIKKITDLEFLRGVEQLESLFLSELLKLNDISALDSLVNLKELALEGNLHGQGSVLPGVESLFSLTRLEYLKFYSKKTVFSASDFAVFENLEYIDLSPSRYPFEFYAELDQYLPVAADKRWSIFYPYQSEACAKCGGIDFVEAVGARQRMFCPVCNKKKLDKLLASYETHSGKAAGDVISHIPFLSV